MSTSLARIAAGMDRAAQSVASALLDERVGRRNSDPLYVHLHDALNSMAAVRLLAELTIEEAAEVPS